MDRGEKCSLRRPRDEELCPVFSVDYRFRCFLLVVPEDSYIVTAEHDELVSGLRIEKPRFEVFSVCEGLDLGRVIVIVYSSFSAIFLNICEFVDCDGVFLIEGRSVQLFRGCDGLFGGGILDEGESTRESEKPDQIDAVQHTPQTCPHRS